VVGGLVTIRAGTFANELSGSDAPTITLQGAFRST
jgi:hypothetical protein